MTKIALVTGASAGFGAVICKELIGAGYKVIGAARRSETLAAMKNELGDSFCPLVLDITDKKSVNALFSSLPENFQPIDILINNAGLALGLEPAYRANFEDWETMIHTNIIGLTQLTRVILPQMVERNSGTIINIGSIAGTYPYPGGNVYGATKAYVRQLSLNLRADLAGKKIRVTNIEPGLCGDTEFSVVRFRGDTERAASVYQDIEYLTPQDIANTISWIISLPEHININSIEMMPVAQSFQSLSISKTQ